MLDVAAVHLRQKLAMLTNGEIIPITLIVDADGEHTEDLEEAVGFSCGPDAQGNYYAEQMGSYSGPNSVTIQ